MKTVLALTLTALAIISGDARFCFGQIVSQTVTLSGPQGPWSYSAGGLNNGYIFGETLGLQSPLVINGSAGFVFSPGNSISITYLSGTIAANKNVFPFTDAGGDTARAVNSNPDSSNGLIYPSAFIPAGQYPAYLGELMGVFTDATGSIVGSPQKIGDAGVLVIPNGAALLDLGVNDDYFGDNVGSWSLSVSENLPEPGAGYVSVICVALLASRRGRSAISKVKRASGIN
jgi:hypothetical protein